MDAPVLCAHLRPLRLILSLAKKHGGNDVGASPFKRKERKVHAKSRKKEFSIHEWETLKTIVLLYDSGVTVFNAQRH
jgi:hypothetical protein